MKLFSYVKRIFFISAISVLFFGITFAQTTSPRPCPVTVTPSVVGQTVTIVPIDSQECAEAQLLGKGIDLGPFNFRISLNDMIGLISTSLLGILVVIFGFKIIVNGYKWMNNDAQDKSKKEAIKGISTGAVGILVALAAYIIVILVRSIFGIGGSDQLINCNDLYIKDFSRNGLNARVFTDSTQEFQRCIQLAGKEQTFADQANYLKFRDQYARDCASKYLDITSPNKILIKDKDKLQQCFIDTLKAVQSASINPTP